MFLSHIDVPERFRDFIVGFEPKVISLGLHPIYNPSPKNGKIVATLLPRERMIVHNALNPADTIVPCHVMGHLANFGQSIVDVEEKFTTTWRLRQHSSAKFPQSVSTTKWWNATKGLKLEEDLIWEIEMDWEEERTKIRRRVSKRKREKQSRMLKNYWVNGEGTEKFLWNNDSERGRKGEKWEKFWLSYFQRFQRYSAELKNVNQKWTVQLCDPQCNPINVDMLSRKFENIGWGCKWDCSKHGSIYLLYTKFIWTSILDKQFNHNLLPKT